MVLDIPHLDWGGRRERTTELTLHLIAEPVEPLLVEQILEARMAPVAAVAVIALHLDHGLRHLPHLAGSGEAQRVGEPRIGVRFAVGAAHAAAHQHVESGEPISLCDYQEAQVVRVHVAAIVVRKRERELELARQVPRAVAVPVGQPVDHEVLLTGEHTARDLAADHELVGWLAVRPTPLTALVAILLLVSPVELEELSARVGEMAAAGSELGREITPQAVALLLHLLDRAERLLGHATTTSRRPSASTWPTSGRLNSGGGSVPLRSNSRTLLPESVT